MRGDPGRCLSIRMWHVSCGSPGNRRKSAMTQHVHRNSFPHPGAHRSPIWKTDPDGGSAFHKHHIGISRLIHLLSAAINAHQCELATSILTEIIRCMAFHFVEENRILMALAITEAGEYRTLHSGLLKQSEALLQRDSEIDKHSVRCIRSIWRQHINYKCSTHISPQTRERGKNQPDEPLPKFHGWSFHKAQNSQRGLKSICPRGKIDTKLGRSI